MTQNERWKVILGDVERGEMSRIVKADDPTYIIGYVIRESRNKAAQADDDFRAKLAADAPRLLAAIRSIKSMTPPAVNGVHRACDEILKAFPVDA
jgi:hypothetical protein